MSHDTIPHANVMLEEMGKITGAWTTEFNNDLNNLKYPKVKDYDGIFLNSIVGEFAADLAVRDGLRASCGKAAASAACTAPLGIAQLGRVRRAVRRARARRTVSSKA